MSMQEIYGLTLEIGALRDFIEKQHGVVVKHSGRLNIEDEIKAIRKELIESVETKKDLAKLIERI